MIDIPYFLNFPLAEVVLLRVEQMVIWRATVRGIWWIGQKFKIKFLPERRWEKSKNPWFLSHILRCFRTQAPKSPFLWTLQRSWIRMGMMVWEYRSPPPKYFWTFEDPSPAAPPSGHFRFWWGCPLQIVPCGHRELPKIIQTKFWQVRRSRPSAKISQISLVASLGFYPWLSKKWTFWRTWPLSICNFLLKGQIFFEKKQDCFKERILWGF
jgi:hypothetical protein